MKIGIMTYFHGVNPGTNIQAYATYLNVKEAYPGSAVEVINYAYKRNIDRPHLVNVSMQSIINDLKRIRKYRNFKQKNILFSKERLLSTNYNSVIDFIKQQSYDRILVGADTLLELNRETDGITPYWLSEKIKAKKFLLAASAKNATFEKLTPNQHALIKNTIFDFTLMGVRDEATYRLIKNFLNSEQQNSLIRIPDPAFTLTIDYSHVDNYIRKKGLDLSKPTICFHVKRDDKWAVETAEKLKAMGYQIVSFRPERFADILLNDLGPLEYMGIFKHFSLMITNKFHDTIFCLKNGTPMLTFPLNDTYANSSGESKYSSLLSQFNLLESNFIPIRSTITPSMIISKLDSAITTVHLKREIIAQQVEINRKSYMDFLKKSTLL